MRFSGSDRKSHQIPRLVVGKAIPNRNGIFLKSNRPLDCTKSDAASRDKSTVAHKTHGRNPAVTGQAQDDQVIDCRVRRNHDGISEHGTIRCLAIPVARFFGNVAKKIFYRCIVGKRAADHLSDAFQIIFLYVIRNYFPMKTGNRIIFLHTLPFIAVLLNGINCFHLLSYRLIRCIHNRRQRLCRHG